MYGDSSSKPSRSSLKDGHFNNKDDNTDNKGREQIHSDDEENSLDANNYDLNDGGTDDAARGYDETKDLFSDNEQEGTAGDADTGTGGGGGGVNDIFGGEGREGGAGGGARGSDDEDDETIDDFSFTPSRDVGSTGKRANPFKV